MYKNIMLKISGESLAGTNEQGFDFNIQTGQTRLYAISLNKKKPIFNLIDGYEGAKNCCKSNFKFASVKTNNMTVA